MSVTAGDRTEPPVSVTMAEDRAGRALSEGDNGQGQSGVPAPPHPHLSPPADAAASAQEVLEEASSRLQGAFRFHSTTIQVESYSEEMRDCRECQPPRD